MNSRHRRLTTRVQIFCALAIAINTNGCEHTEYTKQPLFILHAVDIDNFGEFNTAISVDAVCVEQGPELRCADDIAIPLRHELIAADRTRLTGPPDAAERGPSGHTYSLHFHKSIRLFFSDGVPVFVGDILHIYTFTNGDWNRFTEYAIYVVDDLGQRWYLCGSDRTIACELHLESPPRPEL